MNHLPSIVSTINLKFAWTYLDADKTPMAIVARYEDTGKKKRFHQFSLDENRQWVKGATTPLPLFGLDSLPLTYYEEPVYIFEGEKCAQAAHYLGAAAITSMMGSSQAHLADLVILAGYRHLKKFILIPDNDKPGKKYVQIVYDEVKKACPNAVFIVCELPATKKGEDFIDWIRRQSSCPPDWNGFSPLDEPYCDY